MSKNRRPPAVEMRALIKNAVVSAGKALYSNQIAEKTGLTPLTVCAQLSEMHRKNKVYRVELPERRNAMGTASKGPRYLYYFRGMPKPTLNSHPAIVGAVQAANGNNGVNHRELEMNIKIVNGVAHVTASADIQLANGGDQLAQLFSQMFSSSAAKPA